MSDKIFIIGSTGDIGSKLVKFLLKKNAEVTLYVRDAEKVKNLYGDNKNVSIVQGDYSTVDVFERAIAGHTRLFLLLVANPQFAATKGQLAKIAYGAGVRQIVDLSSFTVNLPYRSGFISSIHREGEEKILAVKEPGQFLVALRPGRFLTTVLHHSGHQIKENNVYEYLGDGSRKADFVSTVDIAETASVVLTEPIEKHLDAVYTIVSDPLTGDEFAGVLSDVLGREIKSKQVSSKELYNRLIGSGMPHVIAYDLIALQDLNFDASQFSVLLDRSPQTFRQWLQAEYNLAEIQ